MVLIKLLTFEYSFKITLEIKNQTQIKAIFFSLALSKSLLKNI